MWMHCERRPSAFHLPSKTLKCHLHHSFESNGSSSSFSKHISFPFAMIVACVWRKDVLLGQIVCIVHWSFFFWCHLLQIINCLMPNLPKVIMCTKVSKTQPLRQLSWRWTLDKSEQIFFERRARRSMCIGICTCVCNIHFCLLRLGKKCLHLNHCLQRGVQQPI
jgi:hypothetical protein